MVPLNFCSFNVMCLFNGLVYYNQWDRLFWYQVVAVLFGIGILVWGVLVISLQPATGSIRLSLDDDQDTHHHSDDSSSNRENSLDRTRSTNSSNYSQPFLKAASSLDEEGVLVKKQRWWTRMKLLYRKKSNDEAEAADEHTGLLNSI